MFPSLDFAQRRLSRLTALRVVDRFRPLKPDGGSLPYHYVLDQLGSEVLAAQRDEPVPAPGYGKARRRRWTSSRMLNHRLGVNGFFTDLAGHARTHPGTALTRWWPEAWCREVGAFAEPDDPPDLKALTPPIHPDGHGIWSSRGLVVPFFLEYDTGLEPLSTLVLKVIGYARFAERGGPRWPVLFWLHSSSRARHLRHEIGVELGAVPVRVAIAARDHVAAEGLDPAGAVWWLPGRPGLLTLAGLAVAVPDRS